MKLRVETKILFFRSPNNLSGTGFVFALALNNKKSRALLKFDIAKTTLLGKIYSLKPMGEGLTWAGSMEVGISDR